MTFGKRLFDIWFAVFVLILIAIPFLIMLTIMLLVQGRPLFYIAERMKTPDQAFRLWKLRTMTPAETNAGVSGGSKKPRITPLGRFLRRTRMDEIPQLYNVLKGDMSIVGPRPPLRMYVERFPEIYAQVLKNRPGATGLATLHFHATEERLLSACTTPEETDHVYMQRCIPRKARLDLIYQRNQSVWLDLVIAVQTAFSVLIRRMFDRG